MHPIEKQYVYDVYDGISDDFNERRFSVWDFVKNFMCDKQNLSGIDIGCGNGKNMVHANMVGIDTCSNLLHFCRKKNKDVVYGCCCKLPFKDNSFDYGISISVFHHLASSERRLKAIHEMIRVVKPGGKCMFNVWSVENQARRTFKPGDNMVSYRNKSQKNMNTPEIVYRYYHIYNYDMINELITFIKGVHNIQLKNEKGNWIIYMTKI